MNMTDIYKAFHPRTASYTFFSSTYRTFSRIDHILGHKTSLSKFKKSEIIPSIFLNHNALKLEINSMKKGKTTNMWRLNHVLRLG